jgi:hypothetical protein
VVLSPDAFADGTPAGFDILGFGTLGASWQDRPGAPSNATATMGVYTNTGTVLTAATVDWARVLAGGQAAVDQITRNVIGTLAGIIPIYGTVIDSQSNPIPGVTVRVTESDPGIVPGIYTTTTDAAGHYRITLYPGLYTGAYSLDTFGPAFVGFNISLGRIRLGATDDLDLRLTRKGILTGRVIDAAGRPITGAGVFVGLGMPIPGDTSTFKFVGHTDAAGQYRLIVDPQGPYNAVAAAASFEDSDPAGITILWDTTTRQDFALVTAMPGSISGTVVDADSQESIERATVEAIVDPTSDSRSTETDATGNYTLSHVPSGRRQVRASARHYSSRVLTVRVMAGRPATANFSLTAEPGRGSNGGAGSPRI